MLVRLERLVSLATLLMHGHLLNSTSHTLNRVLKKAVMVLTMAALPAGNVTPLPYFNRVVPLATKEITLMMMVAKAVGMMMTMIK